ncbi:Thioredoxin superfamily protein [Striga hermonthica]|uniref:Thioredoxin superfamily protein n=1 Tax=Striga hermonthica TaxID=68872 RepID=A0A9N7RGN6_STRHE|nr:Thioredoxin superfamily protein [Striga hermonthica]
MAKTIISPPSTGSLFLPYSAPQSLLPPQSFAISSKPTRFSTRKLRGTSLMAGKSATAAVVADVLGEVGIFTAAGEYVQFKDLWDQEGVAVVALLRHFGCFCCWEFASALKESKEKFNSAGVKLIAVGVGTPDKAQLLAERLPFPLDSLYCDPDRKAYDVLGLYYGLGRTFFNPASVKVFSRFEDLKKAMKNYTIRATPDDRSSVLQQGGMFVFKGKQLLYARKDEGGMFVFKGKQLLYARKDEGTGDHAPLDDILSICCKVPTA